MAWDLKDLFSVEGVIAILVAGIMMIAILISVASQRVDRLPFAGAHWCEPEDRKALLCYDLFEPVCGFDEEGHQVQSFLNNCLACLEKDVDFWTSGECPEA